MLRGFLDNETWAKQMQLTQFVLSFKNTALDTKDVSGKQFFRFVEMQKKVQLIILIFGMIRLIWYA